MAAFGFELNGIDSAVKFRCWCCDQAFTLTAVDYTITLNSTVSLSF